MNHLIKSTSLLSVILFSAFSFANSSHNQKIDEEREALLPKGTVDATVHHEYYSLNYCEDYEQSEWVAYQLTRKMLEGKVKRRDNFRSDPMVETKSASTWHLSLIHI